MADTNDYGSDPYVVNIEQATVENDKFRVAKWTGKNLQLTLMAIQPGDDIGLEVHDDHDQFLRIEEGSGRVEMGPSEEELTYVKDVSDDFAIFVPAGSWHNVTNTGDTPLKLYSIYAPAEHAHGTIHEDKAEADAAEHDH
ncbi:cupin domain-containing protein [Candidatus Saccharibacteria bacterium]|nr:cupin domain-containing protein [Candidatus Saccharibacteria bacterium]MBH1972364.1 cupin domain-containing protein [Candidatus Saccharibacteria bacterium]MBH1990294.1 cupin domain-containing protein [Candidatus Saccharibacteria bacterium]